MGSFKFGFFALTFIQLGLVSNGIFAAQCRIDLPEFQGIYDYDNHSSKIPLQYLNDIYADISDVSLELTGTHTQGLYRTPNLPSITDPPFTDYSWDGVLRASIILKNTELVDYPTIYLSPCQAEYVGVDTDFHTTIPFQDAGGKTTIDWKEMLNSDFNNLVLLQTTLMRADASIITTPKFNLTNVALVFNATPVPEPSSICLFLCGIFGIFIFTRRFQTR